MAMLHIKLLGGFRLGQDAGGKISFSSRKGALLLARLAVPPGTEHRRESLQDLLWGDAEPKRAQGNLRYLLHRLRRTLPPACAHALVCEGSRVHLDTERVAVDVEEFERLVRDGTAEALAEACALYNGDLLANQPVSEPGFEEWLLPERERLRELAREAFWQHFQSNIWQDDTAAAMRDARRYLDIDPYCERMHQALIRLHLALGERALAARHYLRLKETLARDLQIEPGPEIAALVQHTIKDAGHARVPVRFDPAWVLGRDEAATPSDGTEPLPIPERPSIAVLPFKNLSGDLEQEHVADGITEEIITGLSRFHSLLVITPDSSLTHKGKSADVKMIARDLGAKYVLEGTVRRSADRIRITGQLIDAMTGGHIWAERYDRTLDDIFDLQDEISTNIVGSIAPQISAAEVNRVQRLRPDNVSIIDMALRAYDRALSALKNHSKGDSQEAITLAKQVVAIDPRCSLAYAAIAESHLVDVLFAWTPSEDASLARAQEAAEYLRNQDPADHTAYLLLGRVAFMRKQHDLAGMNLHRALDLNPNDVSALCYLAWAEGSSGLPDAAKDHAELALQLNPQDPFTRFFAHWNLAQVAFVTGNYHAGAEYAQHSLIDMPHHIGNLGMLTACLAETRELTRARAVIKEAMRFGPSYVKYKLRGNSYFKQEADHDRYIGALRKAAGDLQL